MKEILKNKKIMLTVLAVIFCFVIGWYMFMLTILVNIISYCPNIPGAKIAWWFALFFIFLPSLLEPFVWGIKRIIRYCD